MKACGARASKTVYSKKELEDMAVARLGWTEAVAKRTGKQALCEALGIVWGAAEEEPKKICSSRGGKKGMRYTKEELIDRIRERNPYINRSRFGRYSFKQLCRLARLPYEETTARPRTGARDARDPHRFFEVEEEEGEPLVMNIPCLERGTKKPFAYQKRVVEHFRHHRGLIAVHSMGSGKTLTALYASQCYLDEHPTHTVVVITPTSLIENFKKEMRDFGDLRFADRYEFFSIEGFYARYKTTARDCRNTFLILDEAHNLRTEYRVSKKGKVTGKQCGVITRCAEAADRVLLLTATPLVNRPGDVAPLLNMIRNQPTDENKIRAKAMNASEEYTREVGLCRFSFYERGKVSKDYPRTDEEDVYLPMPPRFMATYNKVQEELGEDEEVLRTFGSETKLRPFYNGIRRAVNILSELPEEEMVKSPKIKWILSLLRDKPMQKTIIFSHFIDHGLKGIQSRLPAGIRSEFITGSQPRAKRAEIVKRFNDDEVDVLFLSKAGGEGLDLKKTRRIILLESAWNENTEKQLIGRGVRYKSHEDLPPEERHVQIYRLFHVKPSEMDQIDFLLSDAYEVFFTDPTTWISADLMLKKISAKKQRKIQKYMNVLKSISIERNPDCAVGATPEDMPRPEDQPEEEAGAGGGGAEQTKESPFVALRHDLEALEERRRTMRGTREEMDPFLEEVKKLEEKLVRAYKKHFRPDDPYAFFKTARFNWRETIGKICPNRKCTILLEKYLQDFSPPLFPLHRRAIELVINNRSQGGAAILPYLDLMTETLRKAYAEHYHHDLPNDV
jgi:superfamily II DNA or RNA helicase